MSVLKVSAIKNSGSSSNNLVLNADGTLTLGSGGDVTAGLPSGTKQIFVQTAAPTGWTKDTTHNNKAMRVVSGTAGSGGNDAFTTTFGSGKTTASHTLTTSQMPSHTHNAVFGGNVFEANLRFEGTNSDEGTTLPTESTGGGGSHSHNLSGFNLKYVDVIIATKD